MKHTKWIAICLSIVLFFSAIPLSALAEDVDINSTTEAVEENAECISTNESVKPVAATGLINNATVQTQEATVNIADWLCTPSEDGKSMTLDSYNGSSTDVVIPANGDFGGIVEEVHISNMVMKSIVVDKKATSIRVSDNGNPVVAEGSDWGYVFSYNDSPTLNAKNTSLTRVDLSHLNNVYSTTHELTKRL